jgi:hypothetical protein
VPIIADPGGLEAFAAELAGNATTQTLLADSVAGKLLRDEDQPAGAASSPKKSENPLCRSTDDDLRLKPMGTSDMRPSEAPGC